PWGALWLIMSTTMPVSAKICKYRARLPALNAASCTLIIMTPGSTLIFDTPYIIMLPSALPRGKAVSKCFFVPVSETGSGKLQKRRVDVLFRHGADVVIARSEERRVGKEGGAGRAAA